MCFVITNIGWLAQFASDNARDDIVCRSDGVARHQVLVTKMIEVEPISHSQFQMLLFLFLRNHVREKTSHVSSSSSSSTSFHNLLLFGLWLSVTAGVSASVGQVNLIKSERFSTKGLHTSTWQPGYFPLF